MRHNEKRHHAERRRHQGPWWKPDRRSIAPALMGGLSTLIPGRAAPAAPPAMAASEPGREPPEREVATATSKLTRTTLHVPRNEKAERQVASWRKSRPEDARLLERMLSQPTASWFGDWNRDVRADVNRLVTEAAKNGSVPVMVAYNIPNRDCNQYSAGGVGDAAEYRSWVRQVAAGIGDRDAVVILEPDAVALVSCLTQEGQAERFSLIREAVSLLKKESGATVYIDAGHARWVPEEEIAQRLHLAGVDLADGFALNVSNFLGTAENTAYGERVGRRLGNPHFVIDTSRNGGSVADGEWCNPAGAALGQTPTTETRHPLLDALLWIKRPGESDGTCNGGPPAGEWWGEYALGLARGGTRLAG